MSREEILRRFELWLDSALADEEPPRGIEPRILASLTEDAEEPPANASAYSLWAAMTALTQEVKLQGRSFKDLNAGLASQAAGMAQRERDEVRRETEHRCRKQALEVLIDLRDRLVRGQESVRAGEEALVQPVPHGWRARLFQPPVDDRAAGAFQALKKGYELGLERLDQTLAEFGAREIACEGQMFDPRRMNAIDRQESDSVPEGTVMEVYRRGYEWKGEVFRPAQVKVAYAPPGEKNE
jgi:molecular chaperone GrpE